MEMDREPDFHMHKRVSTMINRERFSIETA